MSILIFQNTGCCKKKKKVTDIESKPLVVTEKIEVEEEDKDLSVPDEASKILSKTGLNYYIGQSSHSTMSAPLTFFEKEYVEGIKLLENENYDIALKKFNDLLENYPEGEEASIITLCIAEVYFRTKNNELALQLFKEIVQKYPNSQAAQNAKEGIAYLESFAKYESSFVSPEQDDLRRKRR